MREKVNASAVPKTCHTYHTMMKLFTFIPYLKKIQKLYMNHVTHPISPAGISNISPEIRKFCYIKKYMYRLDFDIKLLILWTFVEFLKIVLIKKVTILMMPSKMATPVLLKITLFWNKGSDVIIYVHGITNKFYHVIQVILLMLSYDQSLVTVTFLWEKLS